MWSRVRIGNNVYSGGPVRRTVVRVDGDPIADFESGANGELVVSLKLFEARGAMIGQVRRNQWVGRQREFEYARAPQRLVVRRTDRARTTVFDASLRGAPPELSIMFANLYTPRGFELIVDPDAGALVRDPVQVRVVLSLSGALLEQALDAIDLPVHRDTLPGPANSAGSPSVGMVDRSPARECGT